MKKSGFFVRFMVLVFALCFVISGFAESTDYTKMLFDGVKNGDIAKVKTAIEHGADVNARDEHGETPLFWAARSDYLKKMCKLLIEHGADVNAKDKEGKTPLFKALNYSCIKVAKFLIEHGADVNAKDNKGYTPLHWAAWGSSITSCRFLIKNGSKINSLNNKGHTPLDMTVFSGSNIKEVVTLLIENGGKYSPFGKLVFAIKNNDFNAVQKTIQEGANVNDTDEKNYTALFYVVKTGNFDICKLLIEHGADVNAKDEDGRTPLFEAAWRCQYKICKLLIDHGADVNVKDKHGKTPFDIAKEENCQDIIKIFKQKQNNNL